MLITPVKNHPALHSICLTNEPRNVEEPCSYATAAFQAWLEKKHGDIGTLNINWGSSFTSFSNISVPDPRYGKPSDIKMGEWYDFLCWNQEFLTSWHKMLADAVHAVAPDVPVNAKVQGYSFGNTEDVQWGDDPYLYSEIMDISGNDGSNCYKSDDDTLKPYFAEWLGCYMYGDLQIYERSSNFQL
jgi:beta-galactosidase GanA